MALTTSLFVRNTEIVLDSSTVKMVPLLFGMTVPTEVSMSRNTFRTM